MPSPNPATRYSFTGNGKITFLAAPITAVSTAFTVDDATGWPDGSGGPFFAIIEQGTNEEKVLVSSRTGNTCTVSGGVAGRGQDGTSPTSHASGGTPSTYPVITATVIDKLNEHANATSGVHGVAGAVVGTTDSQTLSGKTLTSPTINGATLSGTLAGTPTFSGAVTFSGTPVFSTGGSLAGTFSGTPTFSGAVTFSGTPVFSTGASLTGTFSGNPTLSGNPTFTGAPVFDGSAAVQFRRTNATDVALATRRNVTDTNDRLQARVDGLLLWGPGNAGGDVNLFRDAADVLRTNDALTVDGVLKHNGAFTALRELFVLKAATETITSDTTLSDDAELTLPVEANTRYVFTAYINYQGPVAASFKWLFSVPASASFQGVRATSEESNDVNSNDFTALVTVATSGGLGSTSDGMILHGGLLIVGTSGSVTFRWAQSVSNASPTGVREGSWMRLVKA